MLFNEPKLLKSSPDSTGLKGRSRFSALQRAEIAEILKRAADWASGVRVSVLFNEPKLLKSIWTATLSTTCAVSVLFNEPKLLKFDQISVYAALVEVSVLFNEPKLLKLGNGRVSLVSVPKSFSALQRAEIAEIQLSPTFLRCRIRFQCSSTSRNC